MKTCLLPLVLGVLLLFSLSPAHAAGVELIAHPDVEVATLDVREVIRIYQGKTTRWPDDLKIVPVMLRDSPTHETFVEDILGSTPSRFNTYWKQAVFSGRGIPPKSFESELELVKYVASTPGAIGYVSPLTPQTGVKRIRLQP